MIHRTARGAVLGGAAAALVIATTWGATATASTTATSPLKHNPVVVRGVVPGMSGHNGNICLDKDCKDVTVSKTGPMRYTLTVTADGPPPAAPTVTKLGEGHCPPNQTGFVYQIGGPANSKLTVTLLMNGQQTQAAYPAAPAPASHTASACFAK